MEVIIHRGTHQIGGCATEYRTNNTRIFIDFGSELDNENTKPFDIDGVTKGKTNCDAVFFTHYHGDHMGLLDTINEDIALYMGEASKTIAKILNDRLSKAPNIDSYDPERINSIRTFEAAKAIVIGDIKITPYMVDHSAYDAYMFKIEADGKSVLHTGDFRIHGFRGKGVKPTLDKYVKKVDALVCEGTTLNRTEIKCETENDLKNRIKTVLQENKYIFVVSSSTNIDRLAGICSVVPEGKYCICDKYQLSVIQYIKQMKKIALLLSVVMLMLLCGCGTSTKYYTNKAFLSEDTETITYETSSNNVNWGEFQENKDALTGRCVELSAESVTAVDEEEFSNIVKKFKDKMDVLEVPYAVGYNGDRAQRIHIQIEGEKIGLPILALLNINSSYDNVIVSGLGDFRASGVNSMKYELGTDNKYVISIGVPETYQNDFEKYCAENVGKALYLKLGDMTFSSTHITENMSKETVDFHGFSFLGKNVSEPAYEIIMKLADYAVNQKYESPNNSTSFGLSIEGETLYGIPYVTELDEVLIERVNAK